jgi:hypothetical protein
MKGTDMSVEAIGWVFHNHPPDMSGSELLLLLALADRADKFGGKCFPGQDHLAQKTGLKERAIRYNLRKLEARGILRTQRRGGNRSNLYQIVMTAPTSNIAQRTGTAVPLGTGTPGSGTGTAVPVGTGTPRSMDRHHGAAYTSYTPVDTPGDTEATNNCDDMRVSSEKSWMGPMRALLQRLPQPEYSKVRELVLTSIVELDEAIVCDPSHLVPGNEWATYENVAAALYEKESSMTST